MTRAGVGVSEAGEINQSRSAGRPYSLSLFWSLLTSSGGGRQKTKQKHKQSRPLRIKIMDLGGRGLLPEEGGEGDMDTPRPTRKKTAVPLEGQARPRD